MPKIDESNPEAMILSGILSANRRVAELHGAFERADMARKLAKEDWEAAATDLENKLTELDKEYPLFDRAATAATTTAQAAPPDGNGGGATIETEFPALPGPKPKGRKAGVPATAKDARA